MKRFFYPLFGHGNGCDAFRAAWILLGLGGMLLVLRTGWVFWIGAAIALIGLVSVVWSAQVAFREYDEGRARWEAETPKPRKAQAAGAAAGAAGVAGAAATSSMWDDATDSMSPSVNIDGSPMVGAVDIHGNPYGVTNDWSSNDWSHDNGFSSNDSFSGGGFSNSRF